MECAQQYTFCFKLYDTFWIYLSKQQKLWAYFIQLCFTGRVFFFDFSCMSSFTSEDETVLVKCLVKIEIFAYITLLLYHPQPEKEGPAYHLVANSKGGQVPFSGINTKNSTVKFSEWLLKNFVEERRHRFHVIWW